MFDFKAPKFNDPEAAREYLESVRWPNGAACVHCGGVERIYRIAADEKKKIRPGLLKCGDCKQQFTVTVGTVFERSKISLDKWVLATHLMCSSKKGFSAHQMHRTMGITYKTAWFMCHRIREAMKSPGGMFNTSGGVIEADETYIGGKERNKHRSKRNKKNIGGVGKQMVFSLVERGGRVRSMHLPSVSATNLRPILKRQLNTKKTRLMTDGEGQYRILAPLFENHETVNHSIGEYVRGEAHTNTVEGYFSILKRGINGVYQHVSAEHLKRYLGEFDFRYNYRSGLGYTDEARTHEALKGIEGKRLTYKPANA